MTEYDIRKEIFDRLYNASSESERKLFDNRTTRKQASALYVAWRDYQQAKKKEKKDNARNSKVTGSGKRELTFREVMDGLEGLEIICEALAYKHLLDEGLSKDQAMNEITKAKFE